MIRTLRAALSTDDERQSAHASARASSMAAAGTRPTTAAAGLLLLAAASQRAAASFDPVQLGRLRVVPASGSVPPPPPGCVQVALDADEFTFLATADGAIHATTRALLEWLEAERSAPEPHTCLDYGCGSGVLGIAALRLGVAREAILTDISEGAVACARANALRNGVGARCECVANLPSASRPVPRASVCVANMLAGPLADVALDIAGRSLPGCRIALSGFRRSEVPAVAAAYAPYFELDTRGALERDGWIRLCGRRRADAAVTVERLSDSAVM